MPRKKIEPAPVQLSIIVDCCTSGNCDSCRGQTPVGVPIRRLHSIDMSREYALKIMQAWMIYRPAMLPTTDEHRAIYKVHPHRIECPEVDKLHAGHPSRSALVRQHVQLGQALIGEEASHGKHE